MSHDSEQEIESFLDGLRKRNPHELEFHQAVEEVVRSVMPYYLQHDELRNESILERLTEPDRIVIFRVCWEDDEGNVRANRAWRVQFSRALGPYKGGLRFDSSVTQSVLKFLGFEQIFKNALTGLPMGGAKGGANFNPKGKSDREVMRFCQSLMCELHRHIGEDVDVPAGDIGVGSREISYLFGQYTRLENLWTGAMTGKGQAYGGSAMRTEATGYGCVYFCEKVLQQHDREFSEQRIAISGSGNVALYAAEKAIQLGARVVTLSDSGGCLVFEDGLDAEQLEEIHDLKEMRRGRLEEYENPAARYRAGAKPWDVPCDVAMPCATQNELDEEDARMLVQNGVRLVCEGANMPTTPEAADVLRENRVLHAPGKAANAGGVAVSGLEQTQNSMRLSWSREEVDERLRKIMCEIHDRCVTNGHADTGGDDQVDYVNGANLAAFRKVAEAVRAYGVL